MLKIPPEAANSPSHLSSVDFEVGRLSLIWVVSMRATDATNVLQQYLSVAAELRVDCELVIVSDGLDPKTLKHLVRQAHEHNVSVKAISLQAACPYAVALSTAFHQATGDAMAVLPEYLQVDPSVLHQMLDEIREGADFVATYRTPRVDRGHDRVRSRWFNRLVFACSGVALTDINSGLRLLRREVAEGVPTYGELHVYLPVLAANQGYRVSEVAAQHLEERAGDTGFRLCVRRMLDLLTLFFLIRFTRKPFRFFGGLGSTLFLSGATLNAVLAVQRLIFDKSLADRPALVLGTLLIALGIQLFSLGLLGELIIFIQAGGLKDYKVQHVLTDAAVAQRSPNVVDTESSDLTT